MTLAGPLTKFVAKFTKVQANAVLRQVWNATRIRNHLQSCESLSMESRRAVSESSCSFKRQKKLNALVSSEDLSFSKNTTTLVGRTKKVAGPLTKFVAKFTKVQANAV